jgi:hypothetical protein
MQVVLVGGDEERRPLAATLARRYLPFAIEIPVDPSRQDALGQALPFVAAMRQVEGRATAYVCRDFACRPPVTTADALAAELRA